MKTLYNDIETALTHLKMDNMVIYTTPNNSIRCFDLEDNNRTLRNKNNAVLHDGILLAWLLELAPSN